MSPWSLAIACVAAAAAVALLMIRRLFAVIQVAGTSMSPALMPGDRVLVRRWARDRLWAGLIVVFADPLGVCPLWKGDPGVGKRRWMIKRVAAMDGDMVPQAVRCAVGGVATVPPGMLVVLGDSDRSTDSRTWGFLASAEVLGVVVRRLPSARCTAEGDGRQ